MDEALAMLKKKLAEIDEAERSLKYCYSGPCRFKEELVANPVLKKLLAVEKSLKSRLNN